ncbi:transglutaminase domain-containing protein [Chitinophaga sp. Cy-1792]|uniref:transglutaminase domain-containing protein n=1 Tax=Chitinophaga sp. Cy-1792 TaxID=2608339 RepID=UPI001421B2D7|nr:transglutaminase domain-containing protein [Chitinophaga sp. Cy-1792]NIG57094.1 hypothetical protein [Chitinophaga sp. Cy-1792]
MKLYLALAAALVTAGSAFGQAPKPTAAAAATIVSIPEEATGSPAAMAKWLKAHTSSSMQLQRSLYNWIAKNIRYDVPGMYQQRDYRDTTAALQRVLRSREGVCTDYASLYAKVCQEAGIPAFTVNGYCLENGTLSPTGAHDWVAVKNGGQWTITDPTWGAGTVNGATFTPQLNWDWFQLSPQAAIKRHIPFDPMWQLLANPVRHDEVGVSRQSGPTFNYNDTIALYFRSARYERMAGMLGRIERYGGASNPFVQAELDWLRQTVKVLAGNREIEERNRLIDKFTAVNKEYSEVVRLYNDYVTYKNKQFQPEQSDVAIRKMMEGMTGRLKAVEQELSGMKSTDAAMAGHLNELNAAVSDLRGKVNVEEGFVNKYIKTEKDKRRSLFYADVVQKS